MGTNLKLKLLVPLTTAALLVLPVADAVAMPRFFG
jgi:hypothetical protein